MMVLRFNNFGCASNSEASFPFVICNSSSIVEYGHLRFFDPTDKKDSSTIDSKNVLSYLEAHYTGLKSPGINDTIKKTSNNYTDSDKNNSLFSLKNKANNYFITRSLFSLMVRENQPYKEQMAVKSTNYFQPFSGKKIAKIRIQQLNAFGPTLQDTLKEPANWIERTGNSIHIKTTEHKLLKQLLFNTGDALDPQLMAENEKIIRDLPYIQDVEIIISRSKTDPGEVNVLVLIKERFEYGISGTLSSSSSEVEVVNQNMFGIGHQFYASREYHQTENPVWGGTFKYEISDFGAKFIKAGIGYTNTFQKKGYNLFLEKKFLASTMDWAGGISVERTFADYFLTPYSYSRLDTAASYLYSDIWYGQMIKSEDNFSTLGNIILAGRYLHRNYYNDIPDHAGNSYFSNHDFLLGTLGISKRYLFKNNQVYGYGITEDIPYGRYAEAAFGFDRDRDRDHLRPYFHIRYSKANILAEGAYFNWQVGVGGYIGGTQIEQGAISLNTKYFSKFVYFNNHPYRFFVNMELLSGINRFKEEFLVMNGSHGIRDFYSPTTQGTNRLKINIESVRFWGWNYSGFRFAHYFFTDAAFLSNNLKDIFREEFYSGIGIGIRVHNESLVFNVFELRLSVFPILPKSGKRYIFNVFEQPKTRFDDFLGGKPNEIQYE